MVEEVVERPKDYQESNTHFRKRRFVESVIKNGVQRYIHNGTGRALSYELNGEPILLIRDENSRLDRCYLTSVIAQYLGYPSAELDHAGEARWKAFFMKSMLKLGVKLFQFTRVHKVVYIDHNLCSTPTHSENVQQNVVELVSILRKRFPNHTLVFRGLNQRSNSEMMKDLSKIGFEGVLCRRLYFLETRNPASYEKKRPLVQDQKRWKKLKDKNGLKWRPLELSDINTILPYYRQIYLEKYAVQNPDYSSDFIELSQRSGQLEWEVIEMDKEVLGVQAYGMNEVDLNTPFIGYNQLLAKELRLYPSLNVRLLKRAKDGDKRLNMSSGAAEFKRQRGGEPVFEYQFVDTYKKPLLTRFMWRFLAWYSAKFVGPYIVKNHL